MEHEEMRGMREKMRRDEMRWDGFNAVGWGRNCLMSAVSSGNEMAVGKEVREGV